MREQKVKTYYKDIKMKECSKELAMMELIISELVEIKMHVCNGRHFEAGVGLGGLLNSLLNRKDILEEDEIEDENGEDEDEDEEEEKNEGTLKEKIDMIEEERDFYKRNYDKQREENKKITEDLIKCKVYLKDILKKDRIHAASADECIKLFKEMGYSDTELNHMLPGAQRLNIK